MKKLLFFIVIITILNVTLMSENPKILVVSSYDKAYSWSSDLVNAIERVLFQADVEQRFFYMDTRLRDDEIWKIKSGVIALDILSEWQPDVVIACDDNAQQYFVTKIPPDSNVQVVFCGVNNDPSEYGYPKENVTGVREVPFPVKALDDVSKVIPGLKRVAFIGDGTRSAEGHIRYLKKLDMGDYESIGYYRFTNLDDLLLGMKNLGKICDVFYIIRALGFKDKNGELYESEEVVRKILDSTDIPVMGLSDYIVEDGALYGMVPDADFQGTVAAEIALKIANGEKKASDIPIVLLDSPFSELQDGKTYLNLKTSIEKGYQVPIELINETDIIISDIKREEEIVLDYYTLITSQVLNGVAGYLRNVASNPNALSGNWEDIKEIYQTTAIAYPGIFLYILPNGDYYTDIRNFTSTNLSDRPYFKTLLEGEEVLGYPVISRSTGKKSAVFAIPVKGGMSTSGFVGMSLYMEEINAYVNKLMNIDQEIFVMAIDKTGTIMMTNQDKYMYAHADDILECGSGSFTERLNLEDHGNLAFKNGYGEYYGIFKSEETTGWKFVFAEKIYDMNKDTGINEMIEKSSFLRETIVEKMNTLEDEFVKTSKLFADSNELPEDVRGILDELYSKLTDVYDIAFVNTDGIMEFVAPEYFRAYEGADISDQEQVKRIARTYNPVVSDLLMTKEGIYGVDMEWPVFNRRGLFMGSVSMLINPEVFFKDILIENISDPELEIWIMQEDGTIVYDNDSVEIGKNLFEDEVYSAYTELLDLGRKMQKERDGIGEYTFLVAGEDTAVRKNIVWNTVYFHGTEWKVVLAKQQ